MPDYKQGKIYKLEGGGKFYYGSTIQSLPQRRGDHCSDATTRRQKTKVYAFFNSIGWENVSISLVETYPCSTKQELLLKEDEYITKYIKDENCLNEKRSVITDADKKAQKASWYRSEKGQETAKANKEHNKVKIQCDCGMMVSNGCMAKHKKRSIHLDKSRPQSTRNVG